MFAIVTGSQPADLQPETRKKIVKASLECVFRELRDLVVVLPEMTYVQRMQLKAALCECVGSVDCFEEIARVPDLHGRALPCPNCQSPGMCGASDAGCIREAARSLASA